MPRYQCNILSNILRLHALRGSFIRCWLFSQGTVKTILLLFECHTVQVNITYLVFCKDYFWKLYQDMKKLHYACVPFQKLIVAQNIDQFSTPMGINDRKNKKT